MSVEKESYPIDDLEMDSFEDIATKNDEWVSEDGKRKVELTVIGGSGLSEWQGSWIKDVRLLSTDSLVGSELMRVQFSKRPESEEILKTVYVDIFEYRNGQGIINSRLYSSATGGKLEETGKYLLCSNDKKTTIEDYLEALQAEEVRTLPDLPEQIDVNETVRLFVEQLEERNFSTPVLVALKERAG